MIYESLLLYQIHSPVSPEVIFEPVHLVVTLAFTISPRYMEHNKLKKSRPVRNKHAITINIYEFT